MQTDSPSDPRRLVVMRHALAEQTGPSDMGRALTDQGHRDAAEAGRWLAGQGFVADHALVSSADRTQATWAELRDAAGWDLEADVDTALFTAGPEAALDLVRDFPDGARRAIVVGHNPTVAYLAQLLDSGDGDPGASAAMLGGYPPCALAVLAYDGPWGDLDVASAAVEAFHVGRA